MTSPVEQTAALVVGSVDAVAPDKIGVLLDLEAPQAVALNAGQPMRFPRVNGYVLVPNETGALVGLVSWLGIERSPYPKRPGLKDFGLVDLPFPLRKMFLVPLGTLVARGSSFELHRGVRAYPSVGDPVQIPTADQLRVLVEASRPEDRRVTLGTSPMASGASVAVDPNRLFGRHLAVLGNTGSGKSCTVAGAIRWSLEAAREAGSNARPNARFIVLDPNGEYRRTFSDLDGVRVFRVGETEADERALRLPAWMWNSHEWAAFAQAAPGVQRPLLMRSLRQLRAGVPPGASREVRVAALLRTHRAILSQTIASSNHIDFPGNKNCGLTLDRLADDCERYTTGLEQPSRDKVEALVEGVRELVGLRRWTRGTGFDAFGQAELEDVGELLDEAIASLPALGSIETVSEDQPLPFEAEDLPDHLDLLSAEDAGNSNAFIATLILRIRSMLSDARLRPIVAPGDEIAFAEWLGDHIGDDDASNGQVAVVDLSLVPSDVVHLVVAVLSRLVFEALQRYRKLNGSELPTVLVLEEAHTFITRAGRGEPDHATPARVCRESFERIAREGRKFGLGLVLSSQRPSELSPTVLAQCNTFLLHRIVNDRDQDLVARLVPDNLGGLLAELPSLPSQQAVLLGWAATVPVLVHMRHLPPEQRPHSSDPEYWEVWTGAKPRSVDWQEVVDDWTA